MARMLASLAMVLVTISALAALSTAKYTLTDDLSYEKFFQNFDLYSDADPTHGYVQYADLQQAVDKQYVGYLNSSIYLGVDYATKSTSGRGSVRAESTKTWNQGLLIADIAHMPASVCGSWPAFWLLGTGKEEWPAYGEIDLLEGVNDADRNSVTLHTTAGCEVDNSTTPNQGMADVQPMFSGHMSTSDCDVNAPRQDKNTGCSIQAAGTHTYGTDFNKNGGGVYAMEWTTSSISVWFFAHADPKIPRDLTTNPDPSTFGTPMARFAGQGCDFQHRFRDMKIVFNVAFCGDWAGRVWGQACAEKTGVRTCEEFVGQHPEAFVESYWEVLALKWFQSDERPVVARDGFVHAPGRRHGW